ncbi:MAG: aminoacetone oxidase family FAD-binding enzyme [Chloroflexi bacterium HGW-Chloroflexi-6]|nr:MAG: aminoacetone oxidase family FAD-binding enzyme [Chloroflexi bacterium HGW-Chloroflexi-6]
MRNPYDVIIIGGGPAGFFAAIRAAEEQPGARVLIIEKTRHVLGKVLISGGGRCNVTHACFDPAQLVGYYPRGAAALRGAFSRFQPADTVRWFESRGVPLKTEEDGRMFPVSNESVTIAGCLDEAARGAGVTIWTQVTARSVRTVSAEGERAPRFAVAIRWSETGVEETLQTRSLLFATGSDANTQSMLSELGHTIEPHVPSLFTFNIPDPRLEELAGLSVPKAQLRLLSGDGSKSEIAPQVGPLLITHWGLSGPVALRTSAWGARWLYANQYQAGLLVNWVYPLTFEKVLENLQNYKETAGNNRKKPGANPLFDPLPARLWKRLTEFAGISESQNWADVSKPVMRKLAEELTGGRYQITGKGQFKDEFVTCGGLRLDEVDFKTMQSKKIPGLFFAGEVLDIDGLTGGFNFQSAWTTGWLAGGALTA